VTADDSHSDLIGAWSSVYGLLDAAPTSLRWARDVQHMDASEMAARARSLGTYLQSAVDLMTAMRYAPSLALMRTCLEHMVVDWLLFQGRTFVQRYRDVSDDAWARWNAERAAGAEWTQTIRDWHRSSRSGNVRMVREGCSQSPTRTGSGSRSASTTSSSSSTSHAALSRPGDR
jgi:hypothetical protein